MTAKCNAINSIWPHQSSDLVIRKRKYCQIC